jgi:hypothetical protein
MKCQEGNFMHPTERQLRKLIRESVQDEFANWKTPEWPINTEDQSLDRSTDAENAWERLVEIGRTFVLETLPVSLPSNSTSLMRQMLYDVIDYIQVNESETWDLALDYWDGDEFEITDVLFDEIVSIFDKHGSHYQEEKDDDDY